MIVVGIENDEIALFTYFDTSNTVGSLKGGGSVQGESSDGFFDAHLHIDAGQSNGQRDGTGETTAGIQVGGKCHSTTDVNHFTTSRVGFFQSESCQRQQGGYYSGIGHCTDTGIGSVQEMVGRQCSEFGCQFGTAERDDFVGMEFQQETVLFGCLKQATGLFDRENALFAKDITTFCLLTGMDKGKHFTNQEIDVFVASPCIFFGKGVGAEESGDYINAFMLGVIQAAHYF